MSIRKEDALFYHSHPTPGKLAISSTKPCRTQRDLSLAYSPGVAVPCLEIHQDVSKVYDYTGKGNLVAVVSNGTAVLGLGNIGPEAGKPVMEGKAVLFKRFADIDVFDIELNTKDPKEVIRTCQLLEPTFGGINLEDIKAPECFEIERELRRTMKIPVFHDDQHGTAIIAGAALLNALEITGKTLDRVKAVFNGAGASGIACAEHFVHLGVRRENILMCDTHGVVYEGRTEGMNEYKARFAQPTERRTLADALVGADVFFGLSAANCVTPDMLRGMAPDPVVFAMANPDPEIAYELAVATRSDLIMATGRSDYPNQVNNVLGFPFIFRGALDVRATEINEEMKLAATRAIAALAKEDVPDSVRRVYGLEEMRFGRKYIIPTPFDSRVLIWVASAVAQAAMDTGVARNPVDIEAYKEQLARRLGKAQEVTRGLIHKAQRRPVRVVFPEGEEDSILRACDVLQDDRIAKPILLGRRRIIQEKAESLRLNMDELRIVDPADSPEFPRYMEEFYAIRQRKGVTHKEAAQAIQEPVTYGSLMVRLGDAEALVAGYTRHYPDTIRPALQVIPMREGCRKVSGMYMLINPKGQIYFLADTSVNIEPTAEDLADIAIECADTVRRLDVEPRVAMLSFSNFGSARHPLADKVRRATELARARAPRLIIDGELQADTAVLPDLIQQTYPFSSLQAGANVLIFPNLEAGNIAYKLLMTIGGCEAIGPILMGLSKPVHVLQRGCEVADIVNVTAIAVVDAITLSL
ncbi:MAG: NADP-dependent malic enzyme [Bryobacterales bacterium]|nr:NADP-dependent malic enzyme [Bryobacterales bacterium]